MKKTFKSLAIFAASVALLSSCQRADELSTPLNASTERADNSPNHGYVYTQTNNASQNSILIYEQHPNGSLTLDETVASGGTGAGMGLGSQGALALGYDHKWLLAVNAGSNSVSAFKVNDDGSLTLTSTIYSGGRMPISVTIHDGYVYVVNAGTDNIMGFHLSESGMLSDIAGSNQPLSGDSVMPAQISFNPTGTTLYVTEKATNMITEFSVDENGVAGAPTSHPSAGMTPFGFGFAAMGKMVVTNAAGGAEGASSASMYQTGAAGGLTLLDGPVPNGQTAACWIAFGPEKTIGYVTNTGSNTISSYTATTSGDLQLLYGVAAISGVHPIDIIVNGKYVYNINSDDQTIGISMRKMDGSLINKGFVSGVPMSAAGLVAY